MKPHDLANAAVQAMKNNRRMVVSLPTCWKRPEGFPVGTLLCEAMNGNAYSFDPMRVLAYLVAQDLVRVSFSAVN